MSRRSPAATTPATAPRPRWTLAAALLLIAAAVLFAFAPAISAGFLNWDDDYMFLRNTAYRGLSAAHLRWMFTTTHMGHYQPLAWLSVALDYAAWGLSPRAFHVTNVALHAATALLVFLLIRALLATRDAAPSPRDARLWPALLGALLFAVHPLRVESVAWLTERRDVLSGLFFVAALLAYLRAVAPGRAEIAGRGAFAASVLLTLLSLLSKAWGMALPFIMLLLDQYPLRRPGLWRGVVQKWPLWLLAGGAALLAGRAQASAGQGLLSLETHPLAQRAWQSVYGVAYYPLRTLWPAALSPIYPLPESLHLADRAVLIAAACAAALSATAWLARRRCPAFTAAWLAYLVTIAPVLGWAQSGWQLVADRYSYLACLPFAILASAGLHALRPRGARLPTIGFAVVIIALLGWQTHAYARVWRSSRSLWLHALARDPDNWIAHHNFAELLYQAGDFAGAAEHLQRAVALHPASWRAWHDLGAALDRMGRAADAEQAWLRVLPLTPERGRTLCELGRLYVNQRRYDDAARVFEQAARTSRLTELQARGHAGLGVVYRRQRRFADAVREFEQAQRLWPHLDWVEPELHQARMER
ncbi:MAG: tetratricopeptide repeat protein [Phycisphaerae bacterium]